MTNKNNSNQCYLNKYNNKFNSRSNNKYCNNRSQHSNNKLSHNKILFYQMIFLWWNPLSNYNSKYSNTKLIQTSQYSQSQTQFSRIISSNNNNNNNNFQSNNSNLTNHRILLITLCNKLIGNNSNRITYIKVITKLWNLSNNSHSKASKIMMTILKTFRGWVHKKIHN